MCSCWATNSLRPQRGSVIAHINVVLQLIDTGPLVRIVNQDDNEDCFHYVRDLWKGKQLYPGRNGKPAENLCVRIRRQTNTRVVVISATDCLIRGLFFFFFPEKVSYSQDRCTQISKEEFLFFRDLLGRIWSEIVLVRRGFWESWLIFRDDLHQTQAWSVLASRKSNRGGKRPAWITRSSWLD